MIKYDGPFIYSKMPKDVKKAYVSFVSQKNRCNYKKARSYKHWGQIGIKVEYSSRDFVNWYLKNIRLFKKGDRENLVVGRIDHSKNYSLNNIELISRNKNSIEAAERNKKKRSSLISVYSYKNNRLVFLKKCVGTLDAEKLTGIDAGNIWRYINKKMKRKTRDFLFIATKLTKRGPYDIVSKL